MSYRSLAVVVVSVGLLSCSSDDGGGGGGISSLFDALNGEYTLRSRSDCVIEVLGSRVRTLNKAGDTLCQEDDIDGDGETLKVAATLSDDRMSGTFDYNQRYDYDEIGPASQPGCHVWNEQRVEISLDAKKTRGRERQGRFAGLAGIWTGTLTVKETSHREDSCAGRSRMVVVNETYELDSDIGGDEATINYRLTAGSSTEDNVDPWPDEFYSPLLDESGRIDVGEDAAGELRIDGSLVEVR